MSLRPEIIERHNRAFEWGVSDCVQMCADSWELETGSRPDLPTYGSEREAKRLIAAGGGLEAMVNGVLGPPVHKKHAEAGDIVLTAFGQMGPGIGIADPPLFWLHGPQGLVPVELDLAIQVWPCRRP